MLFNKKTEYLRDFEALIEEYGYINIFGMKIRTQETFTILRISISIAVIILFSSAGLAAGRNLFLYAAIAAPISYFLPSQIVRGKIKQRSGAVLANLPDVIDMMASLINAGLTLDESIAYISENLDNPVSRLFKIYHLKIFEGSTRKEAYDTICRISFCTEFRSFIKVIYQSEIIGNPIKDILKDLSKVYRNNQRDFLKMRAEKLESNLVIVIFIFIFVPMLLIFLIPVIPQLTILFN